MPSAVRHGFSAAGRCIVIGADILTIKWAKSGEWAMATGETWL
jgi:hypothetical protein